MMIEIGRLQAAHLDVEIAQAGGDARQLAVALKGFGRHVDRDGEGLRKALEAAVVAAGFGQFVKPALGILDLRARRKIHRRVERDIDHVGRRCRSGRGAAPVRRSCAHNPAH